MIKKLLLVFLVIVLLIPGMSATASTEPLVYKDTVTVTKDGGIFQVGFASIEFKKDYIDSDMLPATFEVQIYAENGTVYIEFSPDTPNFFKKVHIRADAYNGLLYDAAKGTNVEVSVKKQQVHAKHFSRYAFS